MTAIRPGVISSLVILLIHIVYFFELMTPFENASKEAFERRHLKHAGLAAEAEREHG